MLQASLLSLFHIVSLLGGMVVFALKPVPPEIVHVKPVVLVEKTHPCSTGDCGVLAVNTQAVELTATPPSPTVPIPTATVVPESAVTEVVAKPMGITETPKVSPPVEDKKIVEIQPSPSPVPAKTVVTQSNLNTAVNDYRRSNGKGNLQTLGELCQVAETRVGQIATDFSHDGYETLVAPLGYTSVAENIFYSSKYTVNENIEAWHSSSGHRENMLGSFTYGCGIERGGYAVFLFMNR